MKFSHLSVFVGGACVAASLFGQTANGALVINEIFSGGGTSTAGVAFKKDYVELVNTGSTAVNVSGYSLDYASAAGNFGSNRFTFPTGTTIGAGDYLLVTLGTAGSAGADLTGDFNTTSLSLSASAGKVRFVDASVAANSALVSGTGIQDFVGYGSNPSLFEGTAPAAINTTLALSTSISRNSNHDDTNDNAADFTQGTPSPTRASAVPEPTVLSLIGLSSLAMLRRRRA